MATASGWDTLRPLLAMVIYAMVALGISYGTTKSIRLRRWITGKPLILYENGKLYRKNLKIAHLDLSEFLTQCRINGYFDLTNLQSAVLETNGHISFLPLSEQRPITPKDLGIPVPKEALVANVVIDGHVMEKNLQHIGKDREWLQKQLKAQHYKVNEVVLATCDCQDQLTVYPKIDRANRKDLLE